ncbi:MAG: cadmium-translocating P-type ATPase, partial [Clostridia bacterium]|nr:cadmium-translocating P-type ATPase [Clostridia bacterium]
GTEVLGGYIVVDGAIKVKTTKTYRDSAVSKIVDIVSTASDDKSKAEKFISTFAKYYTPVVVITAILLAFIPPFFYETYAEGFEIWLKRGVMMLCVSCPCALVVSVPLSYFCSVGYLAKNGVLVKTTERLSSLGKCTTFAFDKTGTLTTGEFEVTKIVSTKKFQGKVLEICAICEKNSNHPLAKSILKKYGKEITVNAENLVEIAGRGIACEINGDKVLCGNAKFLLENNVEFKSVEEIGVKIYLAVNGEYAGTVILNDVARDTAYGAIMELYDEGVTNTVLLTGDNKEYARVIRKQLNMRQSVSELLPENKVEEIERLMENGEKTVAFVGDGINDAPVLSRADVGIAMGGLGSDLAVESADVVIVDDDLSKVPFALKVAKRANNIAKQNIVVSIAIKVLIMLLSIFGVTSSIWLAIVGDVGVLILAILNSLRSSLKIL